MPAGATVTGMGVEQPFFLSLSRGYGFDPDGGIVATEDGGHRWTVAASSTTLPLHGTYPYTLTFLNTNVGFVIESRVAPDGTVVIGPNLQRTTDAGRTWALDPQLDNVTAVVPAGNTVYALTTTSPTDRRPGPTTVWASTDRGATWTPTAFPTQPVVTAEAETALGASALFIVAITAHGTASLYTSADAGRTWTTTPAPCANSRGLISATSPSDLWLLCTSQPGVGNQGKRLFRTTDAGARWTLTASAPIGGQPTLGALPSSGYAHQLTAIDDTTAYLSLNRGQLLTTTDRGRTWRPATPTGGDNETTINMISPTNGIAYIDGTPWHTTNGSTWTR